MSPNSQSLSIDLSANARTIGFAQRASAIMELPETELHDRLRTLLGRMMPNALVEVTHGTTEYGKDLVLVDSRDPLAERVAAFVVKTGDIRGKTAGVVDEIKSQVDQALKIPVRLKGLLAPKSVNQIFVVVAGAISSNAATRLERQIRPLVQDIWDIEKLVQDFTDYYPEIFYETQVIGFLQKRITELESHPLFAKIAADKNLSEWFVDPTVMSTHPLEPSEDADEFIGGRVYSFLKLKDLIKQSKRLLLVGAPGSGKTAVLAKLALDLMREAFRRATSDRKLNVNELPIFLTARRIVEYSDADALIADQFEGQPPDTNFRISAFLVDGLDEDPTADRDAALARATEFARAYDCSLIVTSRWTEALSHPIPNLQQVELLEFQINQAVRLFEKLIPDGRLVESLRQGLDEIQGQLHMTPLTLTLLIDVVREAREIPSSVTELYDLYFDYALGRHDHTKGIEVLFAHHVKKIFLGELAYERFLERNTLEITREDFDDFAQSFAKRYGYEEPELPQFLHEIDRANVLRVSDDLVEFVHRSFLDYFAAKQLHQVDLGADDLRHRIVELYFSPVWTEVAFFFIGVDRRVPAGTMDAVFDHPGDTLNVDVMKFLSGRLLQAGWHSPAEVKLSGVRRAVHYAPSIRDRLMAALFKDEKNLPAFLGDVYIMILGGMSLGSSWLLAANRTTLAELLVSPTYEKVLQALSLLGAMRKRAEPADFQQMIENTLDSLTAIGAKPEVQGRLLTTLVVLGDGDPAHEKSLKRRLTRVLNRHPGLREILLPARARKARPPSRPRTRPRKSRGKRR